MFSVVIYYLLTKNEVVTDLRPRPEWPVESRTCLPWPFVLKLEEKYVKSLILNVSSTKQFNLN